MKAVLFADRPGRALAPLTDRTCVALLPVAGKALVEHTLEDLAAADVRDLLVVVSPHADAVEAWLGDGARWGLRVEYVLARGDESPDAILGRVQRRLEGDALVIRGDVLRSAVIGPFLAQAGGVPGDSVAATIGGVPAGVRLVRAGAPLPLDLPGDPETPETWRECAPTVALGDARVSLLESFRAYHQANVDAAAGRYPGLLLPGREVAPGVLVGRQTRLGPDCIKGTPVFIGSRCDIKAGAELFGDVVISDDVVVDQRATLRQAVVLPHTYVGELVEVSEAIVSTNHLIDIASGAVTRVTDAFLLADLKTATLGSSVGSIAHRVGGAVLLVLSLPLWLPALLLSLLRDPRAPLRRVALVGNHTAVDDDGQPAGRRFVALEWTTGVPVLRHLPKLLAVVDGDLRLVGVAPLTPAQAAARTEEWELVRDAAPAGLLGPAQLTLGADAPLEEQFVVDAYYARTRTAAGDVRWLLRGVAALASARAWRPRRDQ